MALIFVFTLFPGLQVESTTNRVAFLKVSQTHEIACHCVKLQPLNTRNSFRAATHLHRNDYESLKARANACARECFREGEGRSGERCARAQTDSVSLVSNKLEGTN